MTSSPCFQFTGVATLNLSVSCSESIMPDTSTRAGLLVRIDDEDRTHRGGRIGVRMDQIVERRDLPVGVRDQREIERGALRLGDVRRPRAVLLERVDREADDLDVALLELGFEARRLAEFGRSHGREIGGMREENDPTAPDPLMERDGSGRGLLGEIRSGVSELKRHAGDPFN
jgi:hypothetical protein